MPGDEEEQILIGKGTWLDKVADSLIAREKKLGRSMSLIRVESGLGASGIPHIGSMGDAVRAYGIALALQNFGFKSELIAYSDDMDGLRKIPHGLPEWLKDHIARPVSSIPDPFGSCHASYGAHMSSLLLDGLDRAGIKYTFQSGKDAYRSGILVRPIDTILQNSERLGHKIAEFVGQDKFKDVLPYFPICSNCGRLYTAAAQEYISAEKKVTYHCKGSRIGKADVAGCGHRGEADITKGEGKLAWKVEFAARWQVFDIRFEAYGKDIMDSVKVNDWVCSDILGHPHPFHVRYELFLDKSGKKISKSAGNVLTPQMWMRYGTPESILLLLYKRIGGTRSVSVDDVQVLMDEYDDYEDLYFGKRKEDNPAKLAKIKGIYEYVNKLNPPRQPGPHIAYNFLVQQAEIFPESTADRIDKIFSRLVKYGMAKEKTPALENRIALASNWADDTSGSKEDVFAVALTDTERKALESLQSELVKMASAKETAEMPKEIQSRIFESARASGIEPRDFFALLYRMLFNTERGPRLGNYFLDVGIERAVSIIDKYLSKSG